MNGFLSLIRRPSWRIAWRGGLALGLAALVSLVAVVPVQAQSATQRLLDIKRQQEQGVKPGAQTAAPGQAGQTGNGEAATIEAEGIASYYDDDPARSREEAIEAAQREAVEQASGVFITTETEMRNFDLVSDEVLSRSKGFIRTYEVIKEGRDGPFYNVTVRAVVVKKAFIENFEKSLANLYQRVGKPRVMLVVDEFTGNGGMGEGFAAGQAQQALNVVEKEIRKILLREGFTFIDARTLQSGSLVQQAGGAVDRASLIDSARGAKAELVMLGRGRLGGKSKLQRFNVVEASVGLDVIRTDNGQVMASDVSTGKGLHINEDTAAIVALQKAAQDITPKIMEQVTYLWIKEKNDGQRIELLVENVSFGDLIALRRALGNQVKGVRTVRQKSYSDGTALLEVESRDAPDRLAESLYTTQFGEFRLEIKDVSATTLTVSMVKGG